MLGRLVPGAALLAVEIVDRALAPVAHVLLTVNLQFI